MRCKSTVSSQPHSLPAAAQSPAAMAPGAQIAVASVEDNLKSQLKIKDPALKAGFKADFNADIVSSGADLVGERGRRLGQGAAGGRASLGTECLARLLCCCLADCMTFRVCLQARPRWSS